MFHSDPPSHDKPAERPDVDVYHKKSNAGLERYERMLRELERRPIEERKPEAE
jgi:hypothetical protein